MAMMLGRKVWYGVFCSCCNGPRTVKVERHREERAWRSELRPEGLLPDLQDDPAICRHGCHGECMTALYGSYGERDGCSFTCHP